MADKIDLASGCCGSEFEFGPGDDAGGNGDTDNDPGNPIESGALSPAATNLIERLTRELNTIREGKRKQRSRPSGLYLPKSLG